MARGFVAFGLGVAVALGVGWFAFPRALYVHLPEPLEFRHKTHAEKSGVSQCVDCHSLREAGAFQGIPRTDACGACHAEQVGASKAEATLVSAYIKAGREVPWLEDFRQPDNVWFSHAIHTRLAGLKCADCHGAYGDSSGRSYEADRISGYGRNTLKMSDCEDCHRKRQVEVSCLGCHK